ncbi:KilA-N domain-containing protein [Limnobaculum xujianqingii]|uniref:KilA-N domain-containing protein n=1 Tax=Limnobaculum xujianqingii TaxID=2738837 RepID=UPI001126092D|nr:KilA-N domain-containing protein [Limnobaculum xujianqingii]
MHHLATQPTADTSGLAIDGTTIRQDSAGRYSLNDLHIAAGGEERHKPANFLRHDQIRDLCAEIDRCSDMSIASFESIRGGINQGTYACRELVYAYAMWISPAFNLKVIRTFDSGIQMPTQLTEMEMIAKMATVAAESQRRLLAIEQRVSGVSAEVNRISAGTIPAGWQTIKNLVAISGLSDDKVRALIAAFRVESKKVPFNTPNGVLANATVANEAEFIAALTEVKRGATRPCRSKYWYHPKLGRFEMKEVSV